MERTIPQELGYESIRPTGYFSRFKEWPIEPLSSNQSWNPNEILRFLFRLTNGVMDPYRSHLNFKVTFSTGTSAANNIGCLQVDNSAQSFISQLVVTSNNVEVERITEYDTLAAYLTDIGFSEQVCMNREWEGLGYTAYPYGPELENMGRTNKDFNVVAGQNATLFTTHNNNGIGYMPTLCQELDGSGYFTGNATGAQISNTPFVLATENFPVMSTTTTTLDASSLTDRGFLRNLRAEYNPKVMLRDHLDSTTSYLNTHPAVYANGGRLTPTNIRNGTNLQEGYSMGYRQSLSAVAHGGDGISITYNAVPNTAEFWGFNQPYSPKMGVGCFEPVISGTVPQLQFGYGLVAQAPVPVQTRTFKIPVMSSTVGTLIPPDQFLLIPLEALNNLLMEFTMSPYGMFSSGYQDTHEFDLQGMSTMQKRSYVFSEVYYNLHIYEFPDEEIASHIQSSLTKEIVVTGSCWTLAAQYQIANGSQVRGNWQINTGAPWLSEVVLLYLSNDYMKYSFCRKQFRLSNNIRSMQLRFNADYFPAQPYTGNAGNYAYVDNSGDNSEFVANLYHSYNYMFSTNIPTPRINTHNFAVNGRCYDPTVTTPFYDPSIRYSKPTTPPSSATLNIDTALGMPFFHENRLVGRAAFVYSFEAHGHSRGYIIGVDASKARPFEVILDTWSTNSYPRDQTLYAFTRASCVISYTKRGITVYGR